jgi:hypothetical protein
MRNQPYHHSERNASRPHSQGGFLLLAHRPRAPSPLCEGAFFFRIKVR